MPEKEGARVSHRHLRSARPLAEGLAGESAGAEALKTDIAWKPRIPPLGPYLKELTRGEHEKAFLGIFITDTYRDEKSEASREAQLVTVSP